MADTDVLSPDEIAKQQAILRMGLRPPTLDPTRVQALSSAATVPPPAVRPSGVSLVPPTLGDANSTPVNVREAPAPSTALPNPANYQGGKPRTGILARLGEIGLGLALGPQRLQTAIDWHDRPGLAEDQQRYSEDRQHALDVEAQDERNQKGATPLEHIPAGEMVRQPDGTWQQVGTGKPTEPLHVAPGEMVQQSDGSFKQVGDPKPAVVPEDDQPLGDKVAQLNAAMARRFQVLHPNQKLPSEYALPANATKGDYNRIDKSMSGEEAARTQLQNHFDAQANATATRTDKRGEAGLTANEKYWTDPRTGFVGALQQAQQTKKSIVAGADGNGLLTNLVPTMEVLGINHAAGINRISPQEALAAKVPPEWATQWNAWATRVSSGKLTPELAKQGQQLMDIVIDGAHQKAIDSSKFTAKSHGLSFSDVPAMDRDGNLTTLDKAESKTGSASGSGGGITITRDPKTGRITGVQ